MSSQQSPPAETGRRLACLPRGEDEQLRVNFDEYESHPYISLRMWTRDRRTGKFWPDGRRGVSIRIKELPMLAKAIGEAMQLAEEKRAAWSPMTTTDRTGHRRGSQTRRHVPTSPRPTDGPIRTADGTQGEFSEF